MRRTAEGIRGTSEVMFPTNDVGAPDWQATQMVERTVDYLYLLPPRMRALVMLMFIAIEFGSPFMLSGFGRFSKLSRARRLKVLEGWRKAKIPLFKLLADALKAQLCMMYLSHRDVQHHIGAFKACDRPGDALGLPTRHDVFSATTTNGLREGAL
jgi:hypothetical protein